MATDLHIDVTNKEIILEATQLSFTVQEIGSKTKEVLQQSTNIDDGKVFTWSGFDSLPGGNKTGVVMQMVDGWIIRAEPQVSATFVQILQGIILGTGGANPLGTAANVSYSLAETTVSALLTAGGGLTAQQVRDAMRLASSASIDKDSIDALIQANKFKIEALNEGLGATGDTFYWDPVNGLDGNDGESEGAAKKTFTAAYSLLASNNNDILIIVGTPTITEIINLNKIATHLRGSGLGCIISPSSGGTDALTLGIERCSVSGLTVDGQNMSAGDSGIKIDDEKCIIKDIDIRDCTGIGLTLANNVSKCIRIRSIGSQEEGMVLSGTNNEFTKCDFVDSGQEGIRLVNTPTENNIFRDCYIGRNQLFQVGGVGTTVNTFDINCIIDGTGGTGRIDPVLTGIVDPIGSIDQRLDEVYESNRGRWKIDTATNQMIFFKSDNTTELFRMDLFDSAGVPSTANVFERTKV